MVYQILDDLSKTSSRLEKEAILHAHSSNKLLKKVFYLAYDPFVQFYIRKIPSYTPAEGYQADTLDSVIDSLNMLWSRQVTGNAAIEYLRKLLSSLHKYDAKVLELIIGKDLRCGASVSTANKIWPNLISEYPCMLCSPSDEKVLSKMKFPAMAQLKMDGMRFNAIVKNGACELKSRSGKEIDLKSELLEDFIALANGQNLVFDGELIVKENGVILDRQTGNGILNKAVKGTISLDEARNVNATVWDVIPYEDFKAGYSKMGYKFRFALVENITSFDRIKTVEYKIVHTLDEAREIFEHYLVQGQEGIILKNFNSPWENKRVKHQVKFKAELDCDLRVVEIQPGTGKYEGMVGAYVCESEDGVVKVDIGSGLSDEDRTNFDVIGKIVAVTYNSRIKNKEGKESLFLPRLLEIREDKDTADVSSKIK